MRVLKFKMKWESHRWIIVAFIIMIMGLLMYWNEYIKIGNISHVHAKVGGWLLGAVAYEIMHRFGKAHEHEPTQAVSRFLVLFFIGCAIQDAIKNGWGF